MILACAFFIGDFVLGVGVMNVYFEFLEVILNCFLEDLFKGMLPGN